MKNQANCLVFGKQQIGRLLLHQALQSPSPIENLLGVISIGDKYETWPNGLRMLLDEGLPMIRLEFFDCDPEKVHLDQRTEGRIVPTTTHIQEIVAFTQEMLPKDGTILIHCNAGQSRSPAAAIIFYAVRYGLGNEYKAYQRAMQACSRLAWPSNEMLRLGSRVLGMDLVTPALDRYYWFMKKVLGKQETEEVGREE